MDSHEAGSTGARGLSGTRDHGGALGAAGSAGSAGASGATRTGGSAGTAAALLSGPVERVAAECLARLDAGEALDLDAAAAQLTDEDERALLRDLLKDAQHIQGLLPAQVRPGLLLKDRYRLKREIGSGGMGKVYEALDTQLGRPVAVKVLAALGASSFDPEKLFLQEAQLLAKLQHPNIVAVHELGTDGDITFIVMDLVHGTAVSDVLTRVAGLVAEGRRSTPHTGRLLERAIDRPVPAGRASLVDPDSWFRTAARVVVEVTRTIEEAHGQNVIHRDIKPHNILLRGDGSPVILDFGLAGTLDHSHGAISHGLFGTVGYLAPEQVAASRIGADPRTDVYQIGLLLYEFLTLQRAFPGDKMTALLSSIGRGEFLRPHTVDRGIPFELEAICLKAMELDPARRYQSATALREDLQRYLEGREVPLAARGGVLAAGARTTRYWVRCHKPALTIALTLVAALVTVLIVLRNAPVSDAVVQAFRYNPVDKLSLYAPSVDTVHPGDILGVTIEADEPQYLYAISVFGAQDPPTFIAPMRPQPVKPSGDDDETDASASGSGSAAAAATAATAAATEPETWGQRVAPGTSVHCTRITESSAPGSYEGLWVFTSPEPQPRLEAWMAQLETVASASPEQAVPFDQARAAFELAVSPPLSRGGQPEPLSPAEMDSAAKSLDAASVLGELAWPFTNVHRASFSFRVER